MFKKIVLFWLICLPFQTVYAQEPIPRIDFVDAAVMDVVQVLAKQAGLDVVASADPQAAAKRVTVHLNQVTAEEAIDHILRANGFNYERKGRVILVSTLPQDLSPTAYRGGFRVIKLKYLSADRVSQLISKLNAQIVSLPGERANLLVLRGRDADLLEAEKMIKQIDQPIPQILIESKVVEIAESDAIRLGINYNNGVFKFLTDKDTRKTSLAEDLTTTINSLIGAGKAQVVASPRIATLDNHEAVINIGSRIPFSVPVSSSGSSTQWTVEYIDAGVKLKILPKLGEEDHITADIQPEVSSISEWRATAAGEFPVISTRNASATVRVKNGETIVVGGLMSETDRVNTTRIPVLGHIPLLNFFFQNRTVEKAKTEIVFLITPHVI